MPRFGPRQSVASHRWYTNDHRDNTLATGYLYEYSADDTFPLTFTLTVQSGELRERYRAIYLLDNGYSVRPFYVAGWHDERQEIYLHPFPVNYDSHGVRRMRDDGRGPVDFSGWVLSPRRAFHLKMERLSYE